MSSRVCVPWLRRQVTTHPVARDNKIYSLRVRKIRSPKGVSPGLRSFRELEGRIHLLLGPLPPRHLVLLGASSILKASERASCGVTGRAVALPHPLPTLCLRGAPEAHDFKVS